jgi:hypothetical protein
MDAAAWRKRAAELRQAAQLTRDAERQRILEVLAEDCDEIAADREAMAAADPEPDRGR